MCCQTSPERRTKKEMKEHKWITEVEIPSPMGKIYWFAKCRRCGLRMPIKYLDILPEMNKFSIFDWEPKSNFDMTMCMLNQRSGSGYLESEIMYCYR